MLKLNKNLKTGYICNIDLYELIYNDNCKDYAILKLNNNDNILSHTANKLNMYGKEIKFYKDIAPFININCPKCFHIVNNEKSKGGLLAYLSDIEGDFNSHLNTDITKVVTVIKELIKIRRFVFKTNDGVINL